MKELFSEKEKIYIKLFLGILIQLIMGTFCLLISLYISGSLFNIDWLIKLSVTLFEWNNDDIILNFSIGVFLLCIICSLILFILFFKFILKFKDYKYKYSLVQEQLHEIFTGIIFFLGFFPIFISSFINDENKNIFSDFNNSMLIILSTMTLPYLNSILLKIYDKNNEVTKYNVQDENHDLTFINELTQVFHYNNFLNNSDCEKIVKLITKNTMNFTNTVNIRSNLMSKYNKNQLSFLLERLKIYYDIEKVNVSNNISGSGIVFALFAILISIGREAVSDYIGIKVTGNILTLLILFLFLDFVRNYYKNKRNIKNVSETIVLLDRFTKK